MRRGYFFQGTARNRYHENPAHTAPGGDRLLRRLNGQSEADPYQYFFQFSDVGHLIGTAPLLKPDGDPDAPDMEHFFCPRTVSIK